MKKHPFILNKEACEWPEPFISEAELRKIGNIPAGSDLYLKTQGQDVLIDAANPVDLTRLGVEQIYSVKGEKFQFIINERLFVSHEPKVSEKELRAVGRIPPDHKIFFKLEGPDRELKPDEEIDLRPYPIEEFYSCEEKIVKIKIDTKDYDVKPGKYSVEQIKQIGHVKPSYSLDQIINGVPVELKPGQMVIIKGREVFCSQPPDGSSS